MESNERAEGSRIPMSIIGYEYLMMGSKVYDKNGDYGVVIDCSDIHNVEVLFSSSTSQGTGLYCLSPDCEQYSPLYVQRS